MALLGMEDCVEGRTAGVDVNVIRLLVLEDTSDASRVEVAELVVLIHGISLMETAGVEEKEVLPHGS